MRVRIVAWLVLLVVVALATAGVGTYSALEARLDDSIDTRIAQEVDEFRLFAREGVDPETGRRFTAVPRLLEVAIQRNVPNRDETLLSLVDGRPHRRPAREPMMRLDTDPQVVATLAEGGRPRFGTLRLPRGEVRYATIPARVQGDARTGRYVVVVFRWVQHREIVAAMTTFAWLALGALVVIALVAWLVAGRLLAPVRLVRRTAQQISETDLTRRIAVSGRDDVSELARTFNAMLDRLEDAFRTQRRFLDDAGHELRTPITIVRGHLELLDSATGATERAETTALVLDELDRMSRLVEDLGTLARAQRPDFLHPGPVSLAQLTDDVLDKAAALGRRRWSLDGRAEATVTADGQRLTQALLQLAQNAVAHTEPHDVIALGTEVAGSRVRLWVRDTGPGVPPQEADRIFGRFARGADGRGAGFGLGLAIVTAIAEAGGGRVTLASRPGDGATFILEIPYLPAPCAGRRTSPEVLR
ncbi:MAG: sensor histidine kinase [Carbonactinosporaceae bacterium]